MPKVAGSCPKKVFKTHRRECPKRPVAYLFLFIFPINNNCNHLNKNLLIKKKNLNKDHFYKLLELTGLKIAYMCSAE